MRKPGFTQQLASQLLLGLIGLFVLVPIWSISRLAFELVGDAGCGCTAAGK